jgi:hypothetical protein
MRWDDDDYSPPMSYSGVRTKGRYYDNRLRAEREALLQPRAPLTKIKTIVGLDLGQVSDSSALAVINRITTGDDEPIFQATYLHRWPLGTAYPKIVEGVMKMLDGELFKHKPLRQQPVLAVDATGVGAAVADMFKAANLVVKFVPIIITGGHHVNFDGVTYHVPKRLLVSSLQVVLQTKRFKFAEALPEAATLISEMQNFQLTITEQAHDTYEGRKGSHDDLLLAVALGLWAGQVHKPTEPSPPRSFSGVRTAR